ncbi:MAG: hypothetical protein JXA33_24540 [Anaerolineae bacterium]|nr:hypothetical protein [Anaerolineae bacterium]
MQKLDMLAIDPLPVLLAWDDAALGYLARRDLLEEPVAPVEILWETKAALKLTQAQQPDGSWRYPGKSYDAQAVTNYNLLETYRSLRILVEVFGFHRAYPALQKAAEYLFLCQTDEGDIRGIIGNQYMPLLPRRDPRIAHQGRIWRRLAGREGAGLAACDAPGRRRMDRSCPDGHGKTKNKRILAERANPTGSFKITRTPCYRDGPARLRCSPSLPQRSGVIAAANALKSRLFQAAKYNDRKAPISWLKFQSPFWWSNLLTALDTLSWLGFDRQVADVTKGLDWFFSNQSPDGLWETGYGSGKGAQENRHWVGLAVCRVLKRWM